MSSIAGIKNKSPNTYEERPSTSGGPSASQPFVFNTVAGATNIQSNRTTPNSAVDPTKTGIFSAGNDTTGIAPGAAGNYATVGGGDANSATADYATTAGGEGNDASGGWATCSGGVANAASGKEAFVGGGNKNVASGGGSVIGGGVVNQAAGNAATVAGGNQNVASGAFSAVGGGQQNIASGAQATCAGGLNNTASGTQATCVGGFQCEALSFGDVAGGYQALANSGVGGKAAVALGHAVTASGDGATAFGVNNLANGLGTFTHGLANAANAEASHAEGMFSVAVWQTQIAQSGGAFDDATGGQSQISNLCMRGQTPGAKPNENVKLGYGTGAAQILSVENSKTYAISLYATCAGIIGGVAVSRKLTHSVSLHVDGVGVVTIDGTSLESSVGSPAAAPFNLQFTTAPNELVITFMTGVGVTSKTNVTCSMGIAEVISP